MSKYSWKTVWVVKIIIFGQIFKIEKWVYSAPPCGIAKVWNMRKILGMKIIAKSVMYWCFVSIVELSSPWFDILTWKGHFFDHINQFLTKFWNCMIPHGGSRICSSVNYFQTILNIKSVKMSFWICIIWIYLVKIQLNLQISLFSLKNLWPSIFWWL